MSTSVATRWRFARWKPATADDVSFENRKEPRAVFAETPSGSNILKIAQAIQSVKSDIERTGLGRRAVSSILIARPSQINVWVWWGRHRSEPRDGTA
jgi:hypothetical protein